LGGATGMVISRSVVRDLHDVTESARFYSRLTLIYGLAPMIAPSIGAAILHLTSWHGIFLVIATRGLHGPIEDLPRHGATPEAMREVVIVRPLALGRCLRRRKSCSTLCTDPN
jgi:MFS family permease